VSLAVAGTALAIHPGSLGDVLLTIPALRALRAEGGRLTLAARPHLAALVVALGEADAALDFESLRLDTLFAGEGSPRLPEAERLVCWFGARDADFVRRLSARASRTVVAPSTTPERPVWAHLLATVGGAADRAPARVSNDLVARGTAAVRAAGVDPSRRFVVVHPGAGSASKQWPPEAFAAALAALSDVTMLVHEGPADADPAARLLSLLPSARRLLHPDLPALAGALARCALYVGNDSGVSHLAASVGANCVLLFAGANLAWMPWLRRAVVAPVDIGNPRADVPRVSELLGACLR
jgi:ADP-heptose:LPS heptosyltransferase